MSSREIWESFHRAWTACVGTAGYDKEVWKAAERQVVGALREQEEQRAAFANLRIECSHGGKPPPRGCYWCEREAAQKEGHDV